MVVFGNDLSHLQLGIVQGKLSWIIHVKPNVDREKHHYIHIDFRDNLYSSQLYYLDLTMGEKKEVASMNGGILEVIKPLKKYL